jgi:hypothetical protein
MSLVYQKYLEIPNVYHVNAFYHFVVAPKCPHMKSNRSACISLI